MTPWPEAFSPVSFTEGVWGCWVQTNGCIWTQLKTRWGEKPLRRVVVRCDESYKWGWGQTPTDSQRNIKGTQGETEKVRGGIQKESLRKQLKSHPNFRSVAAWGGRADRIISSRSSWSRHPTSVCIQGALRWSNSPFTLLKAVSTRRASSPSLCKRNLLPLILYNWNHEIETLQICSFVSIPFWWCEWTMLNFCPFCLTPRALHSFYWQKSSEWHKMHHLVDCKAVVSNTDCKQPSTKRSNGINLINYHLSTEVNVYV